jgi:uncharacterized protein (DUF58 family)
MARLRLTRQGLAVLAAGAVALGVGRVFAIIELFVIGAAFFAAVVVAVAYVWARHPRVDADRWIHPAVLVAGDTGQVDLRLHHSGVVRSAPFVLEEPVVRTMTDDHVARLPVPSLGSHTTSTSGYRVPTTTRGMIRLGPLRLTVGDALGIARSTSALVGTDDIVVAPRTLPVDMPRLGQGPLGRALLESSRRLGPGDFHGLREYATGDEPRSIHWRASARSDELMVKEFAVEGLHQCTVVFDASPGAHASNTNFEHGVTAAASLVHSAMRAGLNTLFVTAGGIDLRGPDVAATTLRVLAQIEPTDAPIASFDTDMVDGLVLLVVVTGSDQSTVWRASQAVSDPTITRVLVATTDARVGVRLAASARSDVDFVTTWQTLVGTPAPPPAPVPEPAAATPSHPAAAASSDAGPR